jgi:hypothetical protein
VLLRLRCEEVIALREALRNSVHRDRSPLAIPRDLCPASQAAGRQHGTSRLTDLTIGHVSAQV